MALKDTVGHVEAVVPCRQTLGEGRGGSAQDPVELLEVGEGRLSHPHYQVVVDEAVVVWAEGVELVHGFVPVRRRRRTCGGRCIRRDK